MISKSWWLAAFVAPLCSCLALEARPAPDRPLLRIDPSRLVDLSYTYDADTVYWPGAEGFRHRKIDWTVTDGGYWYASGEFASSEHGGTHLDSPIHFAKGRRTVDEIPVETLIGPAAVIDVSLQAAADRDYRATREDVLAWEEAHGRVAPGSIVVFRTGWGRYWPDRLRYLGDDTPGATDALHFPGLSAGAARLLVERGISGVGIDTASLDHGPSTDFVAHRILGAADVYGLENVANAEALPPTGATLIALPIRIADGTGSPVRIVAILP